MFRIAIFTALALGLAAPALGQRFDSPPPNSRIVSFGDLDLATQSGAQELDRRVQAAARFVCRTPIPNSLIPFAYSGGCVKQALRGAAPKVANAVAFARRNQLRMSAIRVSAQ